MATHTIKYLKKKSAKLLDKPDGACVQPLIWGDEVHVLDAGDPGWKSGQSAAGWIQVHSRGHDGWLEEANLQDDALLDIIFLDVGKGDSCVITTPGRTPKYVLVDTGEHGNVYGYLNWRFGDSVEFRGLDCAVITHGDTDHYGGLEDILNDRHGLFKGGVAIPTLYHNGVVENEAPTMSGGATYVKNLAFQKSDLLRMAGPPPHTKKGYLPLLAKGVASGKIGEARMLCTDCCGATYLPGFDDSAGMQIEVLGPVTQQVDGCTALRYFGSYGRTKNGNSVVLMVSYKDVRVLLSGDLNEESDDYLLSCYGGSNPWLSDVVKWGHHGSQDFSLEFLKAVSPCITVVSSGEDSYCHPRPDTLGAIGKHSRGERPSVYSTELARASWGGSTRSGSASNRLNTLVGSAATNASTNKVAAKKLGRTIAVYGAINLRTDGKRLMMIQKQETQNTWAIFEFHRDGKGDLVLK